uniref:Uncharacterized protein n=1 Tax=Gopherus agassizii TaxID=38772 RepID=A0A452GWJ5_9SAUR
QTHSATLQGTARRIHGAAPPKAQPPCRALPIGSTEQCPLRHSHRAGHCLSDPRSNAPYSTATAQGTACQIHGAAFPTAQPSRRALPIGSTEQRPVRHSHPAGHCPSDPRSSTSYGTGTARRIHGAAPPKAQPPCRALPIGSTEQHPLRHSHPAGHCPSDPRSSTPYGTGTARRIRGAAPPTAQPSRRALPIGSTEQRPVRHSHPEGPRPSVARRQSARHLGALALCSARYLRTAMGTLRHQRSIQSKH